MLAPLPPAELGQLRRGFYTSCQELESNMQLMLDSAELAMIFHVVVLGESAAQAGSMFLGAGGGCAARRSFRSIRWLLRRRQPAVSAAALCCEYSRPPASTAALRSTLRCT